MMNIHASEVKLLHFPLLLKLVSDLNFFIFALDRLCVSAGSFFQCKRGLILTMLGVLTTYIAILIQSVNY